MTELPEPVRAFLGELAENNWLGDALRERARGLLAPEELEHAVGQQGDALVWNGQVWVRDVGSDDEPLWWCASAQTTVAQIPAAEVEHWLWHDGAPLPAWAGEEEETEEKVRAAELLFSATEWALTRYELCDRLINRKTQARYLAPVEKITDVNSLVRAFSEELAAMPEE